ncbi:hypothetical protein ACQ4PT_002075 [Festuca glaucescens]
MAAETPSGVDEEEGRFDWLDQWYPFAPVCDLDPGAPHGKMVLGLRVVAWYDRAVDDWRVPAPPGAALRGPHRRQGTPPVHKNSKACAASYPSMVQNNVLWFYPRAKDEHRDVLQRKRPPFFPQIDDPSYDTHIRNLSYGSDVLVENLLDPAHLAYAHKGLMREPPANAPDVLLTGKLRSKEDPGRYAPCPAMIGLVHFSLQCPLTRVLIQLLFAYPLHS